MDMPASPFRLPLIAILRGIRPDDVLGHVAVLVAAGYDAIEIPLNSPGWSESIGAALQRFGTHASIGAGTVLREAEVDTLHELGARLIVTPNTRAALIRHAVARGMRVVAGCATASEAFEAVDAGAQVLKLFPASVYGPALVRALRAVLPPLPLFAVGGVTPANLADFVAAGCSGAGIGGELYRAGQSPERTRRNAQEFLHAWQRCAAAG